MIKAQHTVPGTEVVIAITQSVRGFIVMRLKGDEIIADLSLMARDEESARKIANKMWAETVAARDLVKVSR